MNVQPANRQIQLREIVEKYLAAAGGYGKTVAIGSLGFSREEVEQVFSTFDEDYHISRYFHFSAEPGSESYTINGFPQSHLTLDSGVQSIL
jgi:hypothetical protein